MGFTNRNWLPVGLDEETYLRTGNVLNYLSSKIPKPLITNTFKLLYLVDLEAVKETGVPVTGLDYNVAKRGPLAMDVWTDIIGTNDLFKQFINVTKGESTIAIKPNPEFQFDSDLFSEYELSLLDKTIDKYGDTSAYKLIQISHMSGHPWDIACKENNITFTDDDSAPNVTNHKVDLSRIIESDYQKANYQNFKENKKF